MTYMPDKNRGTYACIKAGEGGKNPTDTAKNASVNVAVSQRQAEQ